MQLVPNDGGDPITIGDGCDAPDDAPTIGQARSLIARGLAMLDAMDAATTD